MIEIRTILLPTDFSEPADRARPHAFELARRFGAEVTLLHVRTLYSDDPQRIAEEMPTPAADHVFHRKMNRLPAEMSANVRVKTALVREVSPAEGILDYLSEQETDLLVMGTHGRTGLTHFLLGSVAERIVRHAPCPVLTIGHAREHYRDLPSYQNILVPFDFSEHSRTAALYGAELARRFGASLHVLYVIEQEVHPAFYDIWRETTARAIPDIAKDARASLEEILAREELQDLNLHVRLGEAKAHDEIADYAAKNDIHLIVMGTHGLSGLDHALVGSTTERVVRIATCPVLTLKLPVAL
ncbi:MAG: universal stress protein [Acidobacteriota bacterium]